MHPQNHHLMPEKENNSAVNALPLNLWKQLESYHQKLLAQKWGQLIRRMQLNQDPTKEFHDVGN